ncbi:hypothetical protein [Bradyrhizobium sp. Ash2021]|uniref:hypothetical protein n=1 Tax=Bradyrhizobium sp. Ash2021 TaxID=2954771 RepID=UPI002815A53F|nr:hypothetical protein [Bradyrhizobium sp. Ash2021]WMT79679.1 hypothetical protein NL528_45555 [Bradyrhizobium sp. Ash2021]
MTDEAMSPLRRRCVCDQGRNSPLIEMIASSNSSSRRSFPQVRLLGLSHKAPNSAWSWAKRFSPSSIFHSRSK